MGVLRCIWEEDGKESLEVEITVDIDEYRKNIRPLAIRRYGSELGHKISNLYYERNK